MTIKELKLIIGTAEVDEIELIMNDYDKPGDLVTKYVDTPELDCFSQFIRDKSINELEVDDSYSIGIVKKLLTNKMVLQIWVI